MAQRCLTQGMTEGYKGRDAGPRRGASGGQECGWSAQLQGARPGSSGPSQVQVRMGEEHEDIEAPNRVCASSLGGINLAVGLGRGLGGLGGVGAEPRYLALGCGDGGCEPRWLGSGMNDGC